MKKLGEKNLWGSAVGMLFTILAAFLLTPNLSFDEPAVREVKDDQAANLFGAGCDIYKTLLNQNWCDNATGCGLTKAPYALGPPFNLNISMSVPCSKDCDSNYPMKVAACAGS